MQADEDWSKSMIKSISTQLTLHNGHVGKKNEHTHVTNLQQQSIGFS